MNIYLIRHGDAEKSAIGKRDFDRELTEHGKLKLKETAGNWKSYIDTFDFIVSSPLVRAVQTAEIIKEVFNFGGKIIIDEKIAPGNNTESVVEIANSLKGDKIAFVGHQPDLSEHLSNLISHEGAFIEFKKGTVAKVSFSNKVKMGKGTLEFLIPPNKYKPDV